MKYHLTFLWSTFKVDPIWFTVAIVSQISLHVQSQDTEKYNKLRIHAFRGLKQTTLGLRSSNLELKWHMLGLTSNGSLAHLEVILIIKNGSKDISKEGLTSSRSGDSHASYHWDWTMADIQTFQLGLREIITGMLTIYFALIWQLCQQLLLVWAKYEKTRPFPCEAARSRSRIYPFNGVVYYWLDFKVNIKDSHIVTLIAKILFLRGSLEVQRSCLFMCMGWKWKF